MLGFSYDETVEQRSNRETGLWFIGGIFILPVQVWYTIAARFWFNTEPDAIVFGLLGIVAIVGMLVWPLFVRRQRLKYELFGVDPIFKLAEMQSICLVIVAGIGVYALTVL